MLSLGGKSTTQRVLSNIQWFLSAPLTDNYYKWGTKSEYKQINYKI